MDDLTKKLMLQFDDPMLGLRSNAFETACRHLTKSGQSWSGIVGNIEADDVAGLRQDNAKLAAELAQVSADLSQWKAALSKWQKAHDDLKRQLSLSQGLDWIHKHGRRAALCAVVGLTALLGWQACQRD